MKHIMISIKPEYVCKILNKEKLLEIRKSIPKEVLNGEECLVEIYCTKGKPYLYRVNDDNEFELSNKIRPEEDCYAKFYEDCYVKYYDALSGKVVARFTLNKYDTIERDLNDWLPKNRYETTEQQLKNSCLIEERFWEYGKGKTLYAWHIDNLEIYDTPKELSEFGLKRPFQSWGYLKDEN